MSRIDVLDELEVNLPRKRSAFLTALCIAIFSNIVPIGFIVMYAINLKDMR